MLTHEQRVQAPAPRVLNRAFPAALFLLVVVASPPPFSRALSADDSPRRRCRRPRPSPRGEGGEEVVVVVVGRVRHICSRDYGRSIKCSSRLKRDDAGEGAEGGDRAVEMGE